MCCVQEHRCHFVLDYPCTPSGVPSSYLGPSIISVNRYDCEHPSCIANDSNEDNSKSHQSSMFFSKFFYLSTRVKIGSF